MSHVSALRLLLSIGISLCIMCACLSRFQSARNRRVVSVEHQHTWTLACRNGVWRAPDASSPVDRAVDTLVSITALEMRAYGDVVPQLAAKGFESSAQEAPSLLSRAGLVPVFEQIWLADTGCKIVWPEDQGRQSPELLVQLRALYGPLVVRDIPGLTLAPRFEDTYCRVIDKWAVLQISARIGALVAAVATLWFAYALLRLTRRSRRRECVRCGYEASGVTRCPECGGESRAVSVGKGAAWRGVLWSGALGAALFCAAYCWVDRWRARSPSELVELLGDDDFFAQREALRTLVKDKEVVVLVQALRHPDSRVRRNAATGLGMLHDPTTLEDVKKAQQDANGRVRAAADAASWSIRNRVESR